MPPGNPAWTRALESEIQAHIDNNRDKRSLVMMRTKVGIPPTSYPAMRPHRDAGMKTWGAMLFLFSLYAPDAYATISSINLGVDDTFAVLAGSTITNTGASIIDGDLGLSAGTAITGFPPGTVNGTIHNADGVALQAQSDWTSAFSAATGAACPGGNDLSGQDLGGLTLTPGVYCLSSSAQLTGTLTLNSLGDPNAFFLFQIGGTLTTSSASSVVFVNGGSGDNVFWAVGSSATLGTTTAFQGNILALASITLNTGASIGCGRALASTGAVTLDDNLVSIDSLGCEVSSDLPEPGTAGLFGAGLLLGTVLLIRHRK